jgi:hypothetical protein
MSLLKTSSVGLTAAKDMEIGTPISGKAEFEGS